MAQNTQQTKLAVLVVAKPAGNIPRMLNLGQNLRERGVRVLHVGRRKKGSARFERKGDRHWVINIDLTASRLPFARLRQPLVFLEFIVRARLLIRRLRPNYLFTFYNSAAALFRFRFYSDLRKIAWLLDFRHPYFLSWMQRWHERIGEAGWRHADAIVVPTGARLALHYSRRPECMSVPGFVVHNSPNGGPSFSQKSNRRGATEHYGDDQEVKIVYAGTVGKGYGLTEIIRVVGSRRSGVRLLIVGKKNSQPSNGSEEFGAVQQAIKNEIESVANPDRIEWRDAVPYEELGAVLRESDVGYVTYQGAESLNDRFSAPGKAYDYMRENLVLLTDDESPIAPWIIAADCAFVFPFPVDEGHLSVTVDTLISRKADLPAMRQRTHELFDKVLCQEKQLEPLFKFLAIPASPAGL